MNVLSLIRDQHASLSMYWLLVVVIIVISIMSRLSEKEDIGYGDLLDQFFLALWTYYEDSICPERVSRDNLKGGYYYPVGFYWFIGLLAKRLSKLRLLKKVGRKDDFASLFGDAECTRIYLSYTLTKFISNIIFPVISILLVALINISVLGSTYISLLTIIPLSLLTNNLYMGINYCISTRNPGQFLYLIYTLGVYTYILNGLYEYNIGIYLASVILLTCSIISFCTLLQWSQRGMQLMISLLGVSIFYSEGFRVISIIGLIISLLIVTSRKSLSFISSLKAAIFFRVHYFEWSEKAYLGQRYKWVDFPNNIANYRVLVSFIISRYLDPKHLIDVSYTKRNWLLGLLSNRVYIYSLLFICIGASSLGSQITFFTALIPALLIMHRLFNCFGPMGIYLNGNIIFMTLFFVSDAFEYLEISRGIKSIFVILAIADVLAGYFLQFLLMFRNTIRSRYRAVDSDTFRCIGNAQLNIHALEITKFMINIDTNIESDLSILSVESHLQHFIDAMCAVRAKSSKQYKLKLQTAWNHVDNLQYGFLSDYDSRFSTSAGFISHLKPSLIIADTSINHSVRILQKVSRKASLNRIFTSGQLSVYQTNWKDSIK